MTGMIKRFSCPWLLQAGLFAANWLCQIDRALFGIMIVPIRAATVRLPDGTAKEVGPGAHVLACDFESK